MLSRIGTCPKRTVTIHGMIIKESLLAQRIMGQKEREGKTVNVIYYVDHFESGKLREKKN